MAKLGQYKKLLKDPNPSGLCFCGCGKITPIASRNTYATLSKKSCHIKYILGHNANIKYLKPYWGNNKGIKYGPMKEWHRNKIRMALIGKKKKFKNHVPREYYRLNGLKGLLKQQTMKEPTSIEKKLYEELKKRGLLYETQKLINGRFLVDAYIPSLNLIIEADGDYWHSLKRVKNKDKAENAYLTKCGYKLLRLSEAEINNTSFGERIG